MAKIAGIHIERYTGQVRFYRQTEDGLTELTVTVIQPPAGWGGKFSRLVPRPTPPMSDKYERLPGGERKYVPDEDNPKYIAALDRFENIQQAAKIYDCTVKGIEWETPLPDSGPCEEFYASIWAEIEHGFGRGEVIMWLQIIESIGYVGGADIAYYEEQFFRSPGRLGGVPEAPAPEDGAEGGAGDDHEVSGDADSDGASLVATPVPQFEQAGEG